MTGITLLVPTAVVLATTSVFSGVVAGAHDPQVPSWSAKNFESPQTFTVVVVWVVNVIGPVMYMVSSVIVLRCESGFMSAVAFGVEVAGAMPPTIRVNKLSGKLPYSSGSDLHNKDAVQCMGVL